MRATKRNRSTTTPINWRRRYDHHHITHPAVRTAGEGSGGNPRPADVGGGALYPAATLASAALEAADVPGLLAERWYLQELAESHRRTAEKCCSEKLIAEGQRDEAQAECERLRDRHAELQSEYDQLRAEMEKNPWRAECKLREHQLITCGVAATHPDPNLTRTGAYAAKWDSQQAQEVRQLRQERDEVRAALAAIEKRLAEKCTATCMTTEDYTVIMEARRVLGSKERS